MKIFATLEMPFSLTPPFKNRITKQNFVYGAWVASDNFYLALLKHGTFDEYHFFVSSKLEANFLKKQISSLNLNPDKIKIINLKELPACFDKTPYTVFFTSATGISNLSHLRSKYSARPFPICGFTHSVSYAQALKSEIFHNILSDLYPFDSIICTSSGVYKVIQNLNSLMSGSFQKKTGIFYKYKGQLKYLPLGIEVSDCNRISKSEARRKLGLSNDKIIILYFGRFSLYDKADLYPLLLAFKEVLAQGENVTLLLAGVNGQGNYGNKLKNIAKEMGILANVKFIFGVKDKYPVYSAADIFVSPSDNIQESFGLTVLEAMASGLAPVISDWDGYKDLIIHNQSGFHVPTYWANCNIEEEYSFYTYLNLWQKEHLYLGQSVFVDIEKLTRYLMALVKDKNLRLEIAGNARKRAQDVYDWSVVIPAYENFWLELSGMSKGYKIKRNDEKLFMPDYFASFRHYPTKILSTKAKVAITKNGFSYLKTRKLPFKIQEELEDVILIKAIFIILTFLLGRRNAAIAQIQAYAKKILNTKTSVIKYNIMWLLKKGLIKLIS